MPRWSLAAGHRHQVGFLFAIKFAPLPRPGPLIQGTVQTFFHKTPAHSTDRSGAHQQGLGDLLVIEPFIGLA
jgi:hypothetical protein